MWKPSDRLQAASCPEIVSPSASLSLHFHLWKMEAVGTSRGPTQRHETRRACGRRGASVPRPSPAWRCENQPLPGGPCGWTEDGPQRREPKGHAHGALLSRSPASRCRRAAPPEPSGERPSCLLSLLGGRCPWLVAKSLLRCLLPECPFLSLVRTCPRLILITTAKTFSPSMSQSEARSGHELGGRYSPSLKANDGTGAARA